MGVELGGSLIFMLIGGFFALVFGGLGVLLVVLYFRNKKKAEASVSWPSVEGRIVSNQVRKKHVDTDDSFRIEYIPEIRFEYQVNGETFTGKRIAFGSDPNFGSQRKAEEFLIPYPVDSTVKVFYNPEKPKEAVLTQTMRKMTAFLIVGIVLIVMMVCGLCLISFGLINLL